MFMGFLLHSQYLWISILWDDQVTPCPFQARPVAGSLAKSAHHLLFLGYAPAAPKGDLFRTSEDDGMKIFCIFSKGRDKYMPMSNVSYII